ncbi:hypothetical protein CUC08_Gglean007560 [Alternaria sp. MG1]|uniref:Uncharacterized protein n=1 Tax=Alternaria tenuissima TaxID=119927 RepID=A0A4Q4RPT6_9PLEO|nr:hypothetical protein AALT_g7346 [Alternaria alternata]RII08151.1 hypothetical protein CUC08_Gglean007560 [Alternaria sp. MG1]RYN49454.1 hypothetical protein AA0114_g6583 [Alternaria tenuissima]RYN94851.1 hypothetical protein AA0120_g3698 [Alternaria tenuissima]RYN99825.1 hypothetical protein AA0119_g6638 [Alternaria tenuissima]
MAPIPVDNNLVAETDQNPKPDSGYWTKANIALTAVFALIFLAICLASLVFWLHRRNEKKKLDNRKSDTAGLLANEDKTSMFSRVRASSVTLYVDSETEARNKRSSTETMNLVPLQVTPAEEVRDPIGDNTESSGTGPDAESRAESDIIEWRWGRFGCTSIRTRTQHKHGKPTGTVLRVDAYKYRDAANSEDRSHIVRLET